jgi:hypothetical protein
MVHVSSERLPTIVTAEQGKKGEGSKLEDEAPDDDDAPPSDVRRATTVTDEELRAFLALPDTQAQIRKVVVARIRGLEAYVTTVVVDSCRRADARLSIAVRTTRIPARLRDVRDARPWSHREPARVR